MSGETHGTTTPAGGTEKPDREAPTPGAGPHAKPELTNEDATPGAGSLPETGEAGDDAGAG
ncbi:hypothetical protein [Aureimonas sp. AU22]|jgi:hypothetical protein|uniref:hypothetical protein n=1 Tax=Aureimonas sp. AU22 TaxID=1638162 RepID=UPI000783D29A|nr:hypothetical protein [Aureimonas sp. AU22]